MRGERVGREGRRKVHSNKNPKTTKTDVGGEGGVGKGACRENGKWKEVVQRLTEEASLQPTLSLPL